VSFASWCFKNKIIRFFWSFLPPRCDHDECEKRHYRWTEHRLVISGRNGEFIQDFHVCHSCLHKVRQQCYNMGARREDLPDGDFRFWLPNSESEHPEPLKE
jgi:hypothetical protein